MNFRQEIPEYLINRKNTIIQIAFTTLFAFVFINIYLPFGAENWYRINQWQFRYFSGAVVLTGMVTVIISRVILFQLKRSHEITLALYIWLIASEVVFMGGFYTAFEIFFLHDDRQTLDVLLNAVQNTTLILLIPYLLSSLFFAWSDIKLKLEHVINRQKVDSREIMIPFCDDNGKLRITLQCKNVIYIESSDNYITLYYLDDGKVNPFMLRVTMKQLEDQMKDYPIIRCHRSFAINALNVKQIRKTPKNYEIRLDAPGEILIPISRTYEKTILNKFKMNEILY